MRKKRAVSKGTILKRKATNAAKQTIYLGLFGESPPPKYRKS
jgi:hypothetical protein